MNNKSTALQEKIINYVLGNESFTPPTNFYIALFSVSFTTDPVLADLNNEISTVDTGYSRVIYPNNTSYWAGSNGVRRNVEEISFPQALNYWGFVKSWMLLDTSTGGNASNFYYWGNLPGEGKLIDYSDVLTFDVNRLVISEH